MNGWSEHGLYGLLGACVEGFRGCAALDAFQDLQCHRRLYLGADGLLLGLPYLRASIVT